MLKWGGELTPAGRVQAEELGRAFRCMYPGGQGEAQLVFDFFVSCFAEASIRVHRIVFFFYSQKCGNLFDAVVGCVRLLFALQETMLASQAAVYCACTAPTDTT